MPDLSVDSPSFYPSIQTVPAENSEDTSSSIKDAEKENSGQKPTDATTDYSVNDRGENRVQSTLSAKEAQGKAQVTIQNDENDKKQANPPANQDKKTAPVQPPLEKEKSSLSDARNEDLSKYYGKSLNYLKRAGKAFEDLADPKLDNDQQSRARDTITRALGESSDLRNLHQKVYNKPFPVLDGVYPSDSPAEEKQGYPRLKEAFDAEKNQMQRSLQDKITYLSNPQNSIQSSKIQIDRNTPAYKQLIKNLKDGGGYNSRIPAEKQPYVPLPGSTNVVTLSANTPGMVSGDSKKMSDALTDNALKMLQESKPGNLSIFDAYKQAVPLPSNNMVQDQTPLFSPMAKNLAPAKETAVLNLHSGEDTIIRDANKYLDKKLNEHFKQMGDKAPAYHQSIARSEKEVLSAIEKAAGDVKQGEALTVILHSHGTQAPNGRLPDEMRGLLGDQRSYYYLKGQDNKRIPVSYDGVRDLLFKLEGQGKKANLILINCFGAGGIAQRISAQLPDKA